MKTWKTWDTCAFLLLVACLTSMTTSQSEHSWEKPGCHLVGHTRRISIPGCLEFDMETNACRGFCESYSIPSAQEILRLNQKHTVSSFAHCCNIIETEDIRVSVLCFNGPRDLVFRSAKSCTCYHCKKN